MTWCTEMLSKLKVSSHLYYWLGPYKTSGLSPSPKVSLERKTPLWSSAAAIRLGTLLLLISVRNAHRIRLPTVVFS